MLKEIIVNCQQHQTRVAVLEGGLLREIYIEKPDQMRIAGNVYKGKVVNVLPGMQAAFVNIGLNKNAFLPVNEALPGGVLLEEDIDYRKSRNTSIKDLLRPGQEVMVQVTKEPMGSKGARVTCHITLPGRFLVLMPTVNYIGVSQRITDSEERQRLRELAYKCRPEGMGIIVRTAAEGAGEEELLQDAQFLLQLWRKIQQRARNTRAPALLHHDIDLIYRIVRDLFGDDVDKFIIDDRTEYHKILDILNYTAPHLQDRVFLYAQRQPIFDTFRIESEIRKATKRKVWLRCGGYLVIDRTEALTSIDVNTGKFVGSKNLEDTVLKTNLEAAQEIARQLRLRDIGGIIIIDFIDMKSEEHRRKVLTTLEEHLAKDRTKATVLGLTRLGLVEMTRKKVSQGLSESLQKECPYCEGTGRVISEEAMGSFVEQEIKKYLRHYGSEALLVEVNPAVAAVLIGSGGANLRRIEAETGRTVFVRGSESRHLEDWAIISVGSVEEVRKKALPVDVGDILPIMIEEKHASNPQDGIARIEGYILDVVGAGNLVGQRVKVEVTRAFRTYGKARVVS